MRGKFFRFSTFLSVLLLPVHLGAGLAFGHSSSSMKSMAPPAPAAATLEQVRNGVPSSPVTPGNWQTGNLGASQSHYLEGQSAPYRVVMTNLPVNTTITLTIGYDIRNSGKNALDYLTHYNRLKPHTFTPAHLAETINPTIGVSGIFGSPDTCAIPAPSSAGSPVLDQPATSFKALADDSERVMSLWNGTISNVAYTTQGSLTVNQSETRITVTFTVTSPTAVLAWGGHIASSVDWGAGNAAGGISGSPYHMRLINWNLGNLGNQDRSLSAAAVCAVPDAAPLASQTVCKGASATFTTTATGIGTFTYQWTLDGNIIGTNSPSVTISTSSLAVGSHQVCVKVTSNTACGADGDTECTTLTVDEVTFTTAKTEVTCNGANDGTITITTTSGIAPFKFSNDNGTNFQNSNVFTALAPGTFNIVVQDVNNCSATGQVTITQPQLLTANAVATHALCFGGNGAVNLTVSGGTAPYSFLWSNGTTSEDLTDVPAGNYSVTVTDANKCTANATAMVSEPPQLTASVLATNAMCFGGTGAVDLTVRGGTPPYKILWSNGATKEDLVVVLPGSYSVTITDANGCTATVSATVTEPLQLTANAVATNALCNGGNNGKVDLTVSGGTAPYSFLWSTGATSEDLTDVPAGNYSVTVTDANKCTANATATVGEPLQLTANAVATNASCFGGNGAVNLTVTGGTAPYSFSWSNGATSEDLAAVPSGSYSVTVTDANGCTASANVTVNQPAQLLASAVATHASCFGGNGAVNLTVTGGTAPYSFSWSNGATTEDLAAVPAGNYSVTITDVNGCIANANATINQSSQLTASAVATNASCFGGNGSVNLTVSGGATPYSFSWSNGAITEDLAAVLAGSYSVTVTDAKGCIATANATVNEPPQLTASAVATNASCFGGNGAVNLTVSGGTTPYSFAWSNGAITEDLAAVLAGSYSVTITDAKGCIETANATINQSSQLTASAVATHASCFGGNGSVNLTVSGGATPYSFSWSNGAITEDLAAVLAGSYSVTITDAKGCIATANATVNQPTEVLALSETHQNVTCNGGNNGAINLTVSGGTSPYTFAWSNGATIEDISSIAAGDYSVTVTDAKGCTAKQSVTITEPALVTCVLSPPNPLPVCGSTGNTLSAAAGFTNYVWSLAPAAITAGWSITGGQGTNTITYTAGNSNLATFSVIVADANGCQGTCQTSFSCTLNPCKAIYAYCLSDEDPEQLTRVRMDVVPPVKTVVVNKIIYGGSAFTGGKPLSEFEVGKPVGSDTEAMARNGKTGTTYIISNRKSVSALFKLNLQTGYAYSIGYTYTSSGAGIDDINSLAFNDQTKELYGITVNGDRLLKIDTTTAKVTVYPQPITTKDVDLEGASFDHSVSPAQLYVISEHGNGEIFKVSTSTGLGTLIGNTKLGMETIEFTKDGRMFAANNDGNIYQINRTTYVASLFALNEQIDGEGLVFDECSPVLSKSMTSIDEQAEIQQAEEAALVPTEYALHQNYPNPFNPVTRFQFDLPKAGTVKLAIYDIVGHLVRTLVSGEYAAGKHYVTWDATDERGMKVVSGIYFCRFEASQFVAVRKVALVR